MFDGSFTYENREFLSVLPLKEITFEGWIPRASLQRIPTQQVSMTLLKRNESWFILISSIFERWQYRISIRRELVKAKLPKNISGKLEYLKRWTWIFAECFLFSIFPFFFLLLNLSHAIVDKSYLKRKPISRYVFQVFKDIGSQCVQNNITSYHYLEFF